MKMAATALTSLHGVLRLSRLNADHGCDRLRLYLSALAHFLDGFQMVFYLAHTV